jgi:hypothetical protein
MFKTRNKKARERAAEREANLARVRMTENALGPYIRTRPRDPAKAELLRKLGTPDDLIGPVSASATTDPFRVRSAA